VTLPVELPKHPTLVWELIEEPNAEAGSVIVTGWVVVQPLASLTVIVYGPAARLLNVPLAPKVAPSIA
jgi:hypothetical protein